MYLLNISLHSGSFIKSFFSPMCLSLKIARVIPLYKSGDLRLINNYPPVSVLPVFSKLFERIMHNRLVKFIDSHEILNNSQFGFRKNHSTTAALIVLIDKILNGFNNGELTLGIYLDYSKAFDTIDHNILQKKLHQYGIRGISLKWIVDYLHNRKQFVCYSGYNSEWSLISCGVPQGSILGPLLFILYINDLSTVSVKLFSILYADDSNMFIQGKNLSSMISVVNNEMEKIVKWTNSNKLSLNIDKTFFMIFKSRKKHIRITDDIKVNNMIIERIKDIQFLGVILDNHLSWNKHVIFIKNKISKSIGIINKTRKILSKDTLVTLYYSFVYPYLNYTIELWGSTTQYNLNSLHKMQKKIVRMICKVPYRSHTASLFQDLKIFNIHNIYHYHMCLLMFKIYKGQS